MRTPVASIGSLAAAALLLGGMLLLAPPAAQADANGAARSSFQKFCGTWMQKLGQRERHNRSKARVRRNGSAYVVEFVGYSRKPVRCEARPSGNRANPYVGKLVYHELKYRGTGSSAKAVQAATARAIEAVEIMEIFRFDGSRWVY